MNRCLFLLVWCMSISSLLIARESDNVRLFQGFYRDATDTETAYGEIGLLGYNKFDNGKSFVIGAQGGYPVTPDLELNAGLGFISWNPKAGDGQTGLSDVTVSARYLLIPEVTRISLGGYANLPTGKEEMQEGNLNFGAFGAFRHPIDDVTVIVGTLGLDFLETKTVENSDKNGTAQESKSVEKTKYQSCFIVGVGIIYAVNNQLNVVTELHYRNEDNYLLFTYGVDYESQSGSRLRAALGRGFDAGAPDFKLIVTFLHAF